MEQNTSIQTQRENFPEQHPEKKKIWIVQQGGGGFGEGAGWARRPSCSGSPSTSAAKTHSCEAGHGSPVRVGVCKQRLGQVTLSSGATLKGGTNTALLQSEEEWTPIKDTRKKGTANAQGSLGWEQGHTEEGTADTLGYSFLLPPPLSSSQCTPGGGHVTAGGQAARAQGPLSTQRAFCPTYVGTASAGLTQINEATAEAPRLGTGLVSR